MSSTATAVLLPHVERFWGAQRLEILCGRLLSSEALKVRAVDGGARIELRVGLEVEVRSGNEVLGLKALQQAGRLSEGALLLQTHEIAEISDGLTRWTVQFKATTGTPRIALSEQVDVRLFKTVAMVVLFALALIAVLQMPQTEEEAVVTFAPLNARVVAPVEPARPAVPPVETFTPVPTRATAPSAATKPSGAPTAKLTAQETLLKLMGGASVLQGHGLGDAVDSALNALGPGNGPLAAADGLAGMGPRGGTQPGIGPGGIGGVGTVRGPGIHGLPTGLGHHASVGPVAPPNIEGGLDHDVVRKVIERHQSEIKFCYESELHKDATLAGKVAVQFTIDGAGLVSTAAVAEDSMNNDAVQHCILNRVQRWKFPEPKGGGIVSVTYPWLFKSAGED